MTFPSSEPAGKRAARLLRRIVLSAAVGLASGSLMAQSLGADSSNAFNGESDHAVTLDYLPGGDSGGLSFEVQTDPQISLAPSDVSGAIPNGNLSCRRTSAVRLRCAVSALSHGADLLAGKVILRVNVEASQGTFPVGLANVGFYDQLGQPENGAVTAGSVAVTTQPRISISDASILEGDAGQQSMQLALAVSPASSSPVSFDVSTDPGTATPDVDYIALVQHLVIPAGQTSANVSIPIIGDTVIEGRETFGVEITNPVGAAIGNGRAIATIVDNDSPSLQVSDATIMEGDNGMVAMLFRVSLSAPVSTPVSFQIATSGGSATSGVDFLARQATRTIDAGRTSAVFEISVVGDTQHEPNEVFSVTLSNVVGALLTDGVGEGTIQDDDAVALVSIAQVQGQGDVSSLTGTQVQVRGIVTAAVVDGFFLQSEVDDGDEATSDGLFVQADPINAQPGDIVVVAGTVAEEFVGPGTEQLTLTMLRHAVVRARIGRAALPRPVAISGALSAGGPIDALERFESVRVSLPGTRVVGPSRRGAAGARTDIGRFYAVRGDLGRPFLEPGAAPFDDFDPTGKAKKARIRFDGNAERILVDSGAQRGSVRQSADVGDQVAPAIGVLGYGFSDYRFMPDPLSALVVKSLASPKAARAASANEASIAMVALGALAEDSSDAHRATTTEATELAKLSNLACASARSPDILAFEGSVAATRLSEIAASINSGDGALVFGSHCKLDVAYAAPQVGRGGTRDAAFLLNASDVRPGVRRIEVVSTQAFGAAERMRAPDGSDAPLFASLPALLDVVIHDARLPDLNLGLLSVSLDPISPLAATGDLHGWSSEKAMGRDRRSAQLRFIRTTIEGLPAQVRSRLVVLGDLDAPPFDDGSGDLVARLQGPAGSGERLENLLGRLPARERYTTVRDGNALAASHVLVSPALLRHHPIAMDIARINADFSDEHALDAEVPMRVGAPVDPLLLYIDLRPLP